MNAITPEERQHWQIDIIFQEGTWERVICLHGHGTEEEAFSVADSYINKNNIKNAEVKVLPDGGSFWKVRDRQGRRVQRPVVRVQ